MSKHIGFTLAFAVLMMATAVSADEADEPNAALRYWRAWAVIGEEEMERWNVDVKDIGDAEWEPEWRDEGPSELWDDDEASPHSNLRALLEAIETEYCDFEVGRTPMSLLPHLARFRHTGKLLVIRADAALDERQSGKAANEIARVLKVAIHCGSDRVLISSLVGLSSCKSAMALIQRMRDSSSLTPEVCDTLLESLDRIDVEDPLWIRAAIEREHGALLSWLRAASREDVLELIGLAGEPVEDTFLTDTWRDPLAFERAIDSFEAYGPDLLRAFDAGKPEGFEQLKRGIESGLYGPLAPWLAVSFERVHKSHIELKQEIAKISKLLHHTVDHQ